VEQCGDKREGNEDEHAREGDASRGPVTLKRSAKYEDATGPKGGAKHGSGERWINGPGKILCSVIGEEEKLYASDKRDDTDEKEEPAHRDIQQTYPAGLGGLHVVGLVSPQSPTTPHVA